MTLNIILLLQQVLASMSIDKYTIYVICETHTQLQILDEAQTEVWFFSDLTECYGDANPSLAAVTFARPAVRGCNSRGSAGQTLTLISASHHYKCDSEDNPSS